MIKNKVFAVVKKMKKKDYNFLAFKIEKSYYF